MCYLVQLGSINTNLLFKSPILKLILADDFVFTDGFLPFLAFLISSSLLFQTFKKKPTVPGGGFINYNCI